MIKPNFYKQTDKKWQKYNWHGATVARNGCGPSSVANIVSVLPKLKHTKATPLSVFKVACNRGYMHPQYGMYYAGMTKLLKDYGVKKVIHTSNMDLLKKHLAAGDMAVCLAGKSIFTSSGHYIVAYGLKDGTAYVSDSASSAHSRQRPKWATLKQAILNHPYPQCWIIDNTKQYLASSTLLINEAKSTVKQMKKLGFKYTESGNATSWAKALKKKTSNCATYVCYSLQRGGFLKPGQVFWGSKGTLHFKGKGTEKRLKCVANVLHSGKNPKKSGLKVGDICTYSNPPHTQIFAGWDGKAATWYSWGPSDVEEALPRKRGRYTTKKIDYIIRLK